MSEVLTILKRLLDDPHARKRAVAILQPEHFPPGATRACFRLVAQFTDGVVTPNMLLDAARQKKMKSSKFAEFESLLGDVISSPSVMLSEFDYAIGQLTRAAVYDRVYNGVQKAADLVSKGDADRALQVIRDIPNYAEALVLKSDRRLSTRVMRTLKPVPDEDRLFTGFERIDQLTRGGRLGELWLWAAYIGEYKTMSLLSIAHHAMLQGKNVLFISLEMDEEEIMRRLLTMHAYELGKSVPFTEIETGRFTSDDMVANHAFAAEDYDTNPNYGVIELWQPPLGVTIMDVFREVERTTATMECEILVIDYLQKLAPVRQRSKQREEMNDTLDAAKKLALEARGRKRLWVISGWQTSSEGRRTAEKIGKYDLWNLGETLVSAQNANVVCWSLQTQKSLDAKEVKVGLAKNRNGTLKNSQHYLVADPEHCWLSHEPVREEAKLDDIKLDSQVLEELDIFNE